MFVTLLVVTAEL